MVCAQGVLKPPNLGVKSYGTNPNPPQPTPPPFLETTQLNLIQPYPSTALVMHIKQSYGFFFAWISYKTNPPTQKMGFGGSGGSGGSIFGAFLPILCAFLQKMLNRFMKKVESEYSVLEDS